LILVGERLKIQLRTTDVLGRYGGDEFMVLLPETDLATALKIAKRLNRAIGEVPMQIEGKRLCLRCSISKNPLPFSAELHISRSNFSRAIFERRIQAIFSWLHIILTSKAKVP